MTLSKYLISKLSLFKEEADILVKHVRKYYSSLKRLREFSNKNITIYLSMDGVVADIDTAESDCLRENIDRIYPKKDIQSIKKYQIVLALIKDIRNGTTYSPFSEVSINNYLENKSFSNMSSVEKIMNKFYDIFIDKDYIKNLKILPSFKYLANELLLLQNKYNIFFHITNSTRSTKEIIQRSNWLSSNVLPIEYGTYFSNFKNNKSNINSSCILIDSDINNCLLFEEQGSYSTLYNNDPQDCIKKLEAIIKEHF